jgi:hypothetical protein
MIETRSLFLSFGLLLIAVGPAWAQTREIAVVYDDSGSMGRPDNPIAAWRHANYALQALIGLLDPRDVLTVVLMSDTGNPVRIDLRQRASEIESVYQGYRTRGRTPYESVIAAMEVLDRSARNEQATGAVPSEKWLIVLTDGEFQVPPTLARTVREDVREFVARTGAQVIYMLIGDIQPTVARVWVEEAQARQYEARTRPEIIEQMQRIAADITSRSPQGLPVRVQDRTVSFESEFPLRRITVLQQRTREEALLGLQQAMAAGRPLQIDPPLQPRMPAGSREPISGRIVHVRESRPDAVVPPGELRLSFDGAVEPGGVQVLPEVAARLAVWFVDERGHPIAEDGHVIDTCAGDPIYVRATLLSPAGDTLVRQVRLPARLELRLRYGERAQSLTLADGGDYFEIGLPVTEGSFPLSVAAAYPGYFNFQSRLITIRGIDCPIRDLDLAAERWSAVVTELRHAPPLELRPTADGVPVPPGELPGWTFEEIDAGRLRVDVERMEHGWLLRPQPTWGFACFTPTGRIPIRITLRSANPREPLLQRIIEIEIVDVGFFRRCGPLLLALLSLLLFLSWLFGVLRKRRFPRGSEIVSQRQTGSSTTPGFTQKLPRGFASRYLVPFVPERATVDGMTFEAGGRGSYVLIPPRNQTDEMYVAGERLDDPGRRSVRLPQGEALEIRRGRQREIYRYNVYRST